MVHLVGDVVRSSRAYPIFAFFLLLSLALAGVIGLITFDVIDMGMTHFGLREHRIHDLSFGFLFTTAFVGVATQLRRPSTNVAGMVMALLPWGALSLAAVLSGDVERVLVRNPSTVVMPLMVVTALLHPAGRGFFRSFRGSRVSWALVALVVVATPPLLAFASSNIGLQATVTDDHAEMGHYGFMAALSFTVVGLGVLASLRPDGWRVTAWVTGLLPALLGLASLTDPVSSSLDSTWAVAAMAWGVGFVAAAGFSRDVEVAPSRSPGLPSAAVRLRGWRRPGWDRRR